MARVKPQTIDWNTFKINVIAVYRDKNTQLVQYILYKQNDGPLECIEYKPRDKDHWDCYSVAKSHVS